MRARLLSRPEAWQCGNVWRRIDAAASRKQDVDPQIYRSLDAHFAPHNRKLYELVGTDFEW